MLCRADLANGKKLSFLVIRFPHKNRTLFPKNTVMRTSCCSPRYRQGQEGGAITSTQQEMPAASTIPVSWLSSSCSQGIYAAQHSPKGHTVGASQYSIAQHSPALTYVDCDVHH